VSPFATARRKLPPACAIRRADCGAGSSPDHALRPCCAAVGSSIAQPAGASWPPLVRPSRGERPAEQQV